MKAAAQAEIMLISQSLEDFRIAHGDYPVSVGPKTMRSPVEGIIRLEGVSR